MNTRLNAASKAAALAMVIGGAAAIAPAQVTRKPDAPPVEMQDEYTFDAQRWSRLYEMGGEPTILVLARS